MESNKRRRTSSSRAAALDERIEPSTALTLAKIPTPIVEPPTLAFKMHWTEEMERALIVLWKEIVRPQNGKGKNVWKTVASRMEIRFNGCGATDSACKNKFAALKSDYSLYSTMISESGFGGNMVNLTEPKVWQDYVQHFPKAATFRTNPFPHYETMKEVLGDEVFTGKNVTTADALMKKQKQDSTTPSAGDQLVLDQTLPVADGGILSIQEPVSLPAIDDGAPPMATPHVQKEEPQMKKSDVRQDCVSRGVWKRPTKSDMNKEMVQSLSSVLKSSLEAALSPPPTSAPSVLGRAVAYLQASTFATDKPVLWEIIKRLHADEKQAEILLSLGSEDLREGYIREVLLSNVRSV